MGLGIFQTVADIANMLRARQGATTPTTDDAVRRAQDFVNQAIAEQRRFEIPERYPAQVNDLAQSTVGSNLGGGSGAADAGSGSVDTASLLPFSVYITRVGLSNVIAVNQASFVFPTREANNPYLITDLDTTSAVGDKDVYLEWDFDNWPEINEIKLVYGTMGFPVEFASGEQSVGRRKLATVSVTGGIPVVQQYVFNHLIPMMDMDASVPFIYLYNF